MKLGKLMIAVSLVLASCSKDNSVVSFDEKRFVNAFAKDLFEYNYLWADEVSNELASWNMSNNPFDNVSNARMKDSYGKFIDRWTVLMPDSKDFLSSVSSTKSSFGFDYRIYVRESSASELVLVILYVSPGGPAADAGLKRGDIIDKVNGVGITRSNYMSIVRAIDHPQQGTCTFTISKGVREISIYPREFYESPVMLKKIFGKDPDKIGYMLFNSFNMDAETELIEAGKFFRENGVKELILDLRYNSGGYAIIEKVLASILAPKQAIDAKELYSVNKLNKYLTELIGDKSKLESRLSFDFDYELGSVKHKFSTSDANIGIRKLYVLTGRRTASASESLICCISAFLPVEIIGEPTVGKFCGGQLFRARDWYEINNSRSLRSRRAYSEIGEWCMYMMTMMWTDKFGKNSAYPSGLAPDIELKEEPLDMIPLGDAEELLLSKALMLAGFGSPVKPSGKYGKSAGFEEFYDIYYAGEIIPRQALRIESFPEL